ncbi:MAG: glycoside hydrolase family 3 protein [Candidatus Limnocylindria bacterium]
MTDAALGRLMLAFDGLELPEPMRRRLAGAPAAGVTLFRYRNVSDPAQVRALTEAIQSCAPGDEPFLVAIDQEGGQLTGLGGASTQFAGNMALGAADDPELTRRVGASIGRELRAVGVNVDYAPVADLATNPANPSLGVRSFGDDPRRVASHVAAMVEGLESAGVAATLKHFPGKGDAGVDTHHELATVDRSHDALAARELIPFMAGVGAASLVMSGHFAIPALTGRRPATLSATVMHDLLRAELGFSGVTISDSFDMDALAPGDGRLRDAIAAMDAGVDLILLGSRSDPSRFDAALRAAGRDAAADPIGTRQALGRITALRRRLAGHERPELAIVGGPEHAALARELAERSVTLVRDRESLLPLRLAPDDRILAVMPRPADLTPADTSAAVRPGLAAALRRHHPHVDEHLVDHAPPPGQIDAAVTRAREADCLVIGSISASFEPGQASLVSALLDVGRPAVTVALRTPWDLAAYPSAGTHACTYSIVEPSLEALAAALFGRAGFPGRLPVAS